MTVTIHGVQPDLLDTALSYLKPVTQFTNIHCCFKICYTTLGYSLLALIMGTHWLVCRLHWLENTATNNSSTRSQSHITTDRCWAHSGTCDHILLSVWRLLSCLCGVPFLRRGKVCHFSFSVCGNLSVCTSRIYLSCVLQFSNIYAIYRVFHDFRS
jgi:hypothetical protein